MVRPSNLTWVEKLFLEISASEAIFEGKKFREIFIKNEIGPKIHAPLSKDFPGLKVTTPPPFWGIFRNFYGPGRIFENLGLWDFLEKKTQKLPEFA
jgi:hypothetical protein